MDVSCKCSGIAKRQNRYLIATRDSIEEFSPDFTHLESRLKDISDDIAVDGDGCVVFGHYGNAMLTKENPDRNYKVMFTYKHKNLESLYGLAIDNNGFIFVNGKESENIHVLSEDGQLLKLLDVDSPICIKFEKNSQRFFVANEKGTVKIFEATW